MVYDFIGLASEFSTMNLFIIFQAFSNLFPRVNFQMRCLRILSEGFDLIDLLLLVFLLLHFHLNFHDIIFSFFTLLLTLFLA